MHGSGATINSGFRRMWHSAVQLPHRFVILRISNPPVWTPCRSAGTAHFVKTSPNTTSARRRNHVVTRTRTLSFFDVSTSPTLICPRAIFPPPTRTA
ncbi:hypothetical protein FTUN_4824 [Frigoriglobus tundricola]|uniref:Uncharacterized protein n=1 Tax=Frigoriglobus tundricola TaxID=2774151 RepID=A0A6M5YUX9_9BACT|nr:hypothetical protein FTUN_4824 [Frigoriglobus tundricola]